MMLAIRYVGASTARRLESSGGEQTWAPAGEMHAFCLTRGSRATVSMCGVDVSALHVFEDRPFVSPWTGAECAECRRWVAATSAVGA
jgi:hypothetical protein